MWVERASINPKGAPNGSRTRVGAVKGRCPGPLDDGDEHRRAPRRAADGTTKQRASKGISTRAPGDHSATRMVSPVGIEPTTNCVKASCSTTELRARPEARRLRSVLC